MGNEIIEWNAEKNFLESFQSQVPKLVSSHILVTAASSVIFLSGESCQKNKMPNTMHNPLI